MKSLFLLISLALCLSGTRALAQPSTDTDERARIHFEAGNSYYERGSYEDAVREFRLSHSLSERPELLFNIYSAYERLGQLEEAESFLARYAASDISEEQRRNADARLETLRERMSPGTAEDEEQGLGGTRKAAIALWAIGAAGLIDFAVFGVLSSSEANELSACSPICNDEQVSTLRTYNILADVGLAVGVASVLTGTILWIVGKASPVQVGADDTGARVQFTTHF